MALIPWKPFDEFDRLFNDDFALALPSQMRNAPEIDVYEKGDNVIAEASLPGVDPDNIDITVENNVLTVSGSHEEKQEDEDKERGYFRREIRRGSFQRSIRLPAAVKNNTADATYEDGVLKIVMDKTEEADQPKKIEIKRGSK